jgi:hypothetical protein
MRALDALDAASTVDLLITRVKYAPGKPNGVALARITRAKRPNIRILFMAVPESVEHIAGWGEYISLPAATADAVTAAQKEMGRQFQPGRSDWRLSGRADHVATTLAARFHHLGMTAVCALMVRHGCRACDDRAGWSAKERS